MEEDEAPAVAMLQRALALDPELADSYDNLMLVGDLLRATQSPLLARHHYALAATIEPLRFDVSIKNALGCLVSGINMNHKRALQVLALHLCGTDFRDGEKLCRRRTCIHNRLPIAGD